MPTDNRRICGPERTIPYSVYSTDQRKLQASEIDDEYKLRPIFIRTGIISQATGSAYIEVNKTKIIVSVYGPREVLKRRDFSIKGQLNCEFRYVPYSCAGARRNPQLSADDAEMSEVISSALEPAICMQKFPKSVLDVFIVVLEDDGDALAASLTCASLAVSDAGVEMYDVVVGASLRNGICFRKVDNPRQDETSVDSAGSSSDGVVTLGLLPALDQIVCFLHHGVISTENLSKALKILMQHCQQIYPAVQKCLLKTVKRSDSCNGTPKLF